MIKRTFHVKMEEKVKGDMKKNKVRRPHFDHFPAEFFALFIAPFHISKAFLSPPFTFCASHIYKIGLHYDDHTLLPSSNVAGGTP